MRVTRSAAPRTVPPALTALLAALALASVPASGQEVLRMSTARQVSDQKAVEMEVQYGAGQLEVRPAEEGLLYQATLRYDGRHFRPIRRYRLSDGTARVELGLEGRDGEDLDLDWSDLDDLDDLDLSGLEAGDASDGRLEVGLSREVPTSLEVAAGATEGTLRLGGLPLRRLSLETGASETEIEFDRPNPVPMEELRIQLGAARLEATGLGNAGATSILVEGAAGDVVLDFTGQWSRRAEARIKMGLGSLTLRIPDDLGVRLEKSGLLSSFSGLGLEKAGDGTYRTPNWEDTEHRLDLTVDAAFGSIDVEVVD